MPVRPKKVTRRKTKIAIAKLFACYANAIITISLLIRFRSSYLQIFFKLGVLKKFCNIYRKTLVLKSFLIMLQAFSLKFIKRGLQRRCFPVNIAKFSTEHFWTTASEDRVVFGEYSGKPQLQPVKLF